MSTVSKRYILLFCMTLFFLMPLLLWGNLYMVGGDDARLYYLFPLEYLKNYSFQLIGHNTLGGNLGYFPVSYSVPVITFLFFIKSLLPFVNTQLFTYGLIFSFGFLFFYLLTQEFVLKHTRFSFWAGIVVSFLYSLSPYVTKIFYTQQQLSIFLIMVLPACVYLYLSGLRRKQLGRIIGAVMVYSICSSTLLSAPWFLPSVVVLMPFILWVILHYKHYFWKTFCVAILVFLLCNAYWIVPFMLPLLFRSPQGTLVASYRSTSFTQENASLIESLTYLNTPVRQITQSLRTGWQEHGAMSLFDSIGILYLATILYAGMFLHKVKKQTKNNYVIISISFILAVILITPNFGSWNTWLFTTLNTYVPFFGMFRTMYDKFALAMAFVSALLLFLSFLILDEMNAKARSFILIVLFVYTMTRAVPFVRPVFADNDYSTRISGVLNNEFGEMVQYIKALNTTQRFVWYPMTYPGYVYIADAYNGNHFYSGISPLQLFSGASDLSGFYGLSTPLRPDLNWRIADLLKNKSYKQVIHILASQNVGYVIVNHDTIDQRGWAFLEQFDFVKSQNDDYLMLMLGEKMKDFGARYTIYKMNPSFVVPTVFLSTDVADVPVVDHAVRFSRLPSGDYDVDIEATDSKTYLIFLEPYSNFWRINLPSQPRVAYEYGNAWELPAGPKRHIHIHFWPNDLIMPSVLLSIASFVGAFVWILYEKKHS